MMERKVGAPQVDPEFQKVMNHIMNSDDDDGGFSVC
jgi:hypothetical protein